jgi:hypothetical protein
VVLALALALVLDGEDPTAAVEELVPCFVADRGELVPHAASATTATTVAVTGRALHIHRDHRSRTGAMR